MIIDWWRILDIQYTNGGTNECILNGIRLWKIGVYVHHLASQNIAFIQLIKPFFLITRGNLSPISSSFWPILRAPRKAAIKSQPNIENHDLVSSKNRIERIFWCVLRILYWHCPYLVGKGSLSLLDTM